MRGIGEEPLIRDNPRPELTAEQVLFWPVRKYEVVYKIGSQIGIAAILHGSRDIKRILCEC